MRWNKIYFPQRSRGQAPRAITIVIRWYLTCGLNTAVEEGMDRERVYSRLPTRTAYRFCLCFQPLVSGIRNVIDKHNHML